MTTCGSPGCACMRTRGKVYKTPQQEEAHRQLAGRTLDRLTRIPGLMVTHRDGSVWITIGGYKAPITVGHGFIGIRTEFPKPDIDAQWTRTPLRMTIPVPKDPSNYHKEAILKAVRESHQRFLVYEQQHDLFEAFRKVLGPTAKVEGLEGQLGVVTIRRKLDWEQARRLREFLDELGG